MKKESNYKKLKLGEVYLMYFSGDGSVQNGWRPGIVFQNNVGNEYSPNVVALPLTTSLKKKTQPTHVILPSKDTGLEYDSMVLCENPQPLPKERIGKYLTTIPDDYMTRIAEAYLLSSCVIAFIKPDALMSVWKRAVDLNAV